MGGEFRLPQGDQIMRMHGTTCVKGHCQYTWTALYPETLALLRKIRKHEQALTPRRRVTQTGLLHELVKMLADFHQIK
jgi:hypothetical protein